MWVDIKILKGETCDRKNRDGDEKSNRFFWMPKENSIKFCDFKFCSWHQDPQVDGKKKKPLKTEEGPALCFLTLASKCPWRSCYISAPPACSV